jgi:flagellar motility protein MotE (MotC chaperone)
MALQEKRKKGQSGRWVFLLSLGVLTVLLLLFLLDIGGIRNAVLSRFQPKTEDVLLPDIDQLRQELAAERTRLQEMEDFLLEWETALSRQEQALQEQALQADEIEREAMQLRTQYFSHLKELEEMVRVYERMEPPSAAAILLSMEAETAVLILKSMKAASMAEVLSAMPPDKAAGFSELLLNESIGRKEVTQ